MVYKTVLEIAILLVFSKHTKAQAHFFRDSLIYHSITEELHFILKYLIAAENDVCYNRLTLF